MRRGSFGRILARRAAFLYYSLNVGAPSEIRIGSLDSAKTDVVIAADSRAVYAEPGYVLFARESTLMAQ